MYVTILLIQYLVRGSCIHPYPTGRHDLPYPRIEQLHDVRGDQVV